MKKKVQISYRLQLALDRKINNFHHTSIQVSVVPKDLLQETNNKNNMFFKNQNFKAIRSNEKVKNILCAPSLVRFKIAHSDKIEISLRNMTRRIRPFVRS